MNLYLADTFRDALSKLDAQAAGAAKQAVLDFHLNPDLPSGKYHRIKKSKDKNFWSWRVNDELRLVIHQSGDTATICYVDHHDAAYEWARRRRFEVHPTTGSVQIVEVEERIEEIVKFIPKEVEQEPALFANCERDYLLAIGVPEQWLDAVLLATESSLDILQGHLPEEAHERLLSIACGIPVPRPVTVPDVDPYRHPDASRRFQLVEGGDELRRALDQPWERWTVYLHPIQREVAQREFKGPARVTGGAGTGKTVVALHRAYKLAQRNPAARVLLTTYSRTLAARLARSGDVLIGSDAQARSRIEIIHLHKFARDFYVDQLGQSFTPLTRKRLDDYLRVACKLSKERFTLRFLRTEWDTLIDNLDIRSMDEYLATPRTGRGTPMGPKQRQEAWKVFQAVLDGMDKDGVLSWNGLCVAVADAIREGVGAKFDHAIVDESQDFGPCELALVRALVNPGPNDIMLCGDAGQRIYKGRSSLLSTGIDVRGRSTQLRVNYRTTEQIRQFADGLMPATIEDADGDREDRKTISLLRGPKPDVRRFAAAVAESSALTKWLDELLQSGIEPHQIALFGRSNWVIDDRIVPAVENAGATVHHLSDDAIPAAGSVAVGTMHRAKGLEFKAVAVVGCDQDLLPNQTHMKDIDESADRDAFIEGERQLLYVACTRARDRLLVTIVGNGSIFLEHAL